MKPKRTHGLDWIDSHSLKVANPLIEDSLILLSIKREFVLKEVETSADIPTP
jgi:hypothetical protein